jgi:hypothetical protein
MGGSAPSASETTSGRGGQNSPRLFHCDDGTDALPCRCKSRRLSVNTWADRARMKVTTEPTDRSSADDKPAADGHHRALA